jgi:hypothetical protein
MNGRELLTHRLQQEADEYPLKKRKRGMSAAHEEYISTRLGELKMLETANGTLLRLLLRKMNRLLPSEEAEGLSSMLDNSFTSEPESSGVSGDSKTKTKRRKRISDDGEGLDMSQSVGEMMPNESELSESVDFGLIAGTSTPLSPALPAAKLWLSDAIKHFQSRSRSDRIQDIREFAEEGPQQWAALVSLHHELANVVAPEPGAGGEATCTCKNCPYRKEVLQLNEYYGVRSGDWESALTS